MGEKRTGVFSLLMVDPESWGAGVGSALHNLALRGMAEHGLQAARLTVPEGNIRAQRFYERNGWRRTAARRYPTHGLASPCWSMCGPSEMR
jgi:ribosomal protein S18 acetylase RimI-like enzyme